MNLPIAALQRLDAMAENARRVRTSRNELLAALIATTSVDGEALEEMLDQYRRLSIADVIPHDEPDSAGNVVVPMRKPGRPSGSSGR